MELDCREGYVCIVVVLVQVLVRLQISSKKTGISQLRAFRGEKTRSRGVSIHRHRSLDFTRPQTGPDVVETVQ